MSAMQLLKDSTIQSIRRRMKTEDQVLAASMKADHKNLYGDAVGEDEVGDIINYGTMAMPEQQQQQAKKAASGLAKSAMGAALLATGVGGGAGATLLLNGAKDTVAPIVQDKGDEIRYMLDLGEPE